MKQRKTVTDKVLAANRANARKSTGPLNTNAVKHNAIKHGLLAQNLLFKSDEEKGEFEELLGDLMVEQKSAGPLERILVEDAAVSIWKLRTTNGWDLQELANRRKAGRAVLETVAEHQEENQLQLFSRWNGENSAAARRGWDCEELVVRTGTRNAETDETLGQHSKATGHVQIEAKLTTSLDAVLRYQAAIRRDLYRAIAALRHMRHDREEGT